MDVKGRRDALFLALHQQVQRFRDAGGGDVSARRDELAELLASAEELARQHGFPFEKEQAKYLLGMTFDVQGVGRAYLEQLHSVLQTL